MQISEFQITIIQMPRCPVSESSNQKNAKINITNKTSILEICMHSSHINDLEITKNV